jgi:AGCS family alanine or glycine:cation symporter
MYKLLRRLSLGLVLLAFPLLLSAQEELGIDQKIDQAFKPISDFFGKLIFFEIGGTPFVLILLVLSALFFTIYFGFVNFRRFGTALNVVRGKYDEVEGHDGASEEATVDADIRDTIRDESEEGEVSHFQALATAVSGTVGNGNIAGVALAIALGGPGATFWMIICGFLGMSTKFVECTLGVQYRDVGPDGTVYGGPMYYLTKGLKEKGYATAGKVLAVLFAIFCIGGSFGGGNAAQSNQATIVIKDLMGYESAMAGSLIGLVLAILVGIIIIGGIKRIASVTEKVVPFMAGLYVIACLYIILSNFSLVGGAFGQIFTEAFTPRAGIGGMIGVLLIGFKRAAFSNEAGAGSASIAHSAVRTRYSASEGLVALLEPFIDTVVICTMTALVIIIFNSTGGEFLYGLHPNAVLQPDGTYNAIIEGKEFFNVAGKVYLDGNMVEGAAITTAAFGAYIPFSKIFLAIAVVLFAVSTMISWSYYGLQSWKFLFGRGKTADMVYKIIFCLFIIIGAAASMSSIWAFSDAMIFAMVFPNMIGLFFLFPVVKRELNRYLKAIGIIKA